MPLKFCANLNFLFTEIDNLKDRYAAAKSAGFTAVELGNAYDVSMEELQQCAQQTGLEHALINVFPG